MRIMFDMVRSRSNFGLNDVAFLDAERKKREKVCERVRKLLPDNDLFMSSLADDDWLFNIAMHCITNKDLDIQYLYAKKNHIGEIEEHIRTSRNINPFLECIWEQMYGEFDEKVFNRLNYILRIGKSEAPWQLLTAFAFFGNPQKHFLVQENAVRHAACMLDRQNDIILALHDKNWASYQRILDFAEEVQYRMRSPFASFCKPDADLVDVQALFFLANMRKNDDLHGRRNAKRLFEFVGRQKIERTTYL